MQFVTNAEPSSVSFPLSDPPSKQVQSALNPRSPYLPFRRISLPTAPTLLHRESVVSVVSVASFDSLAEDQAASSSVQAEMRNGRKGKGRPTSIDGPKRSKRKDVSVKPVDEARESKRRKVIAEFYETERAYVDGLELIYSLFLTPIIASLSTPHPLLDRGSLTSVFSNFIDIWNLHCSFFSALSNLLSTSMSPSESSTSLLSDPPPLSPILLAHFPYLSLYTPFVTAFSSTISSLLNLITPPSANFANPHYSPAFASFLKIQEADPRCGKLKLRDWLLSIVQRCPRYLLLLKDLINCTPPEDPEHAQLTAVHTLVSKITLSLNASLHTHAQTLSLLALQRSTPNLPFQLIVPGRTLLKRGPLLQVERSAQPREREFLLFSDCLIWLAGEDTERRWKSEWGIGRGAWSSGYGNQDNGEAVLGLGNRPVMIRSRSKSEAELTSLRTRGGSDTSSPPSKPAARSALPPPKNPYQHPASNMIKPHSSSTNAGSASGEEKWIYKGKVELVDMEVIVSPPREIGEERRLEVLSPEGSFVLYAATEEERNQWSSEIRQAKAQLLISLNITHPNSTLTSSSSTEHLRRSLQALPFPPSDERLWTLRDGGKKSLRGKRKKEPEVGERRGIVEHWVPPIWIPDEKACMRCGRTFGWRRRRHHCRLCGKCVCGACSEKTFFISDPSAKVDSSKPARACNACYETVFPLLDPHTENSDLVNANANSNTITSLNNFPSWLTVPSFPLDWTPQALMAIDREPSRRESEPYRINGLEHHAEDRDRERRERIRGKSQARPRSYSQILEDFEIREQEQSGVGPELQEREGAENDQSSLTNDNSPSTPETHIVDLSLTPPLRRENTARRNKRVSLPAIALQVPSFMVRTQPIVGEQGVEVVGKAKRFSLMLARDQGAGASQSELVGKRRKVEDDDGRGRGDLAKGIAAGLLNELLGRTRTAE